MPAEPAPIELSSWFLRHDPLSQGLTDRWRSTPLSPEWKPAHVPAAWQQTLGTEAVGLAWYRVPVPEVARAWLAQGLRVRLRFEAAATDAWVWLGNTEIGRHVGDWLPFEFDLTDALRRAAPGEHLFVRVDQYHAPRPPKGVVIENGHIGKGFHDVLSIQHAGLWDRVTLRPTPAATIPPLGLALDADPRTGRVAIHAELEGDTQHLAMLAELLAPDGRALSHSNLRVTPGHAEGELLADRPILWSPQTPTLYTVRLTLRQSGATEVVTRRVGYRDLSISGPRDDRQIQLNGTPVQIRGMLHWGHEPKHIAPAPPRDQVRDEFRRMKELGFNTVCVCMWYAPEYFYDLADEMGLLVWQEHPVWKSRMSPDVLAEYRRLYEGYLRRDRQHPSVVIAAATCEHEAFDAELAKWWWQRSGELLPRTLRQIQTGFLEWTPPGQTDLYDDHVYDNPGRWVNFLADMRSRLSELPPKPFVMGETILSNAWPDPTALDHADDAPAPWWRSKGLAECRAFERELTRRQGPEALDRFRVHATIHGQQLRKFQGELVRLQPGFAGFVTNSLRDVPICRIGFMDDQDRWRFSADDIRPWFDDAVLLLETPEHLRGLPAARPANCAAVLSNFSSAPMALEVDVMLAGQKLTTLPLRAAPGQIVRAPFTFTPPATDAPRVLELTLTPKPAANASVLPNRWPIVVLPDPAPLPAAIARLDALPFSAAEREPEFEERSYSSGWGLPCRTWAPALPSTETLLPAARSVRDSDLLSAAPTLLITHRLTPNVHTFLERGGRVVLLAHRHAGSLPTMWVNLWGLLPLIVSDSSPTPAIAAKETDAVLHLLRHDLTRATTRAIPSDDRGLTDHVDPIIRYVYTHDSGVPRLFDAVASARVHAGLLVVSTLDHATPAGRWLLHQLLRHAHDKALAPPTRELDITPYLLRV